MILWAISPPQPEARHNLGFFYCLAALAAIACLLLELFFRAQFAKKVVGEFFQFLANISGLLTARRIQRRAQFRRWVWECILFWIFVIAHGFLLKVKQR